MRLSDEGLVAEKVTLRIGANEILRDIDLELAPSEVLALVGPSGAGKTTLFRALVGEIQIARGRIRLGAHDITREPLWKRARRGLGYVPQTPSVLWDLSVEDNLGTFERLVPTGKPLGAKVWAERIGLLPRLEVRARDLSGGERRRLEIGRALIARPRFLVCDEPFAGLDPASAFAIGELLREEREAGMSIVLADHHVAEALRISDRAALLLGGRIVAQASPGEIQQHPSLRQHYLGAV